MNAVSIPNRVYTATVVDLASLNPDYAALRIAVGDKVTLVDRLRQIKVEHQIMKLVIFPNEPERNIAELGQLSKSLEAVITESKDIEEVINELVPPMISSAMINYSNWDRLHITNKHFAVTSSDRTWRFDLVRNAQGVLVGINEEEKNRVITYG